jgi:PhnB protein
MKETTDESHFVPEGWHTLTPRIVAQESKQLIEFLKKVFNASGEYRQAAPSVVTIGDSLLMISEVGIRGPMPAFLYVYVRDTDATYRRALESGARSIEEPSDMPYGDRRCMVEDKWGNTWQIATYRGEAAPNTTP